jgi:hypothetical protein
MSRIATPAPCTISRPDASGALVAVTTVTRDPVRHNDWEPDVVTRRYVLIATQETGEEMHAGYARSYAAAERLADAWMAAHPEHRGVAIAHV